LRAYLGTHFEGEFHLVKRSSQIGGRNAANDGAAFVALDIRLLSSDDANETAATAPIEEIMVRSDRDNKTLELIIHWKGGAHPSSRWRGRV
jgi:hypothetical protein